MENNTRTAIGYICIALCIIAWLGMLGWIGSPRDFTFNVEMDNNTKEAMQSIDYNAISETGRTCYSERCYFDIEENQIGGCSMYVVDCKEFEDKFALEVENDVISEDSE